MLLRKDLVLVWNNEAQISFQAIKYAIVFVPILAKLDFDRDFQIYTNATVQEISIILI